MAWRISGDRTACAMLARFLALRPGIKFDNFVGGRRKCV
jgi:hypothetical protein